MKYPKRLERVRESASIGGLSIEYDVKEVEDLRDKALEAVRYYKIKKKVFEDNQKEDLEVLEFFKYLDSL